MKKILFYAVLMSTALVAGQPRKIAGKIAELNAKHVTFKKVAPLSVAGTRNANADKIVGGATYATLSPAVTADISSHKYEYLELDLPYNGSVITMQLYRVNILAEGFHADTDKATAIPVERGAYYRGIIQGDNNSIASFSFFEKEMNGIVSGGEGNIVAGKLHGNSNERDYIIYSDGKMKVPNPFRCNVNDDRFAGKLMKKAMETARNVDTNRCVTVYFEIDYNLYQQNGFSTANTTNWMTSVFNNVQTLYENDGISVALRSIYIWTSPDPYQGDSSSDYLMQFNQVRPVFDGDVGQLVGIDPGGLGGVAVTIGGLCSDENFSYADVDIYYEEVPAFSWTVEVITHEMGHLLGSPHTHGCYWNGNNTAIDGCGTQAGYVEGNCATGPIPFGSMGTIMSYCHLLQNVGIDLSNGFGLQPGNRIRNHINSSPCLSTDCVNTCINTVAAYAITDAQPTSATIQWTDTAGFGPWQVAYGPVNGALGSWQTVNSSFFTVTGLVPNTYYRFAVRPVCTAGLVAGINDVVFASGADYCSGISFTDTGADENDYPNNQHLIRTFRPENPGQNIIVTFNYFSTEPDFDFMYIYDGPTTSAPLIGAYSGVDDPGVIESTAPDGSLTFEFVSDQFLTFEGWDATVTCSALSSRDNVFSGFGYYPNPSKDVVVVHAQEQLEQVMVYNVTGQLLMQKTLNAATGTIDLGAFADGVYLFKVTGSGKETYFRIVKQN